MMRNKVLKYIKENRMIEAGESVVAGVSGGADSMCLLHILASLKEELSFSLAVVHVHHGIRGETADRDALFVEKYCRQREIPFFLYNYDVPALAKTWGMSCEEAGRKDRYESFQEVLKKTAPDGTGKIAVAHNADDGAETVLLNLFRGCGIKGLCGIQPVREQIIRPILCLSRKEIEQYDLDNNIEYVTDETNLLEEYTRNKIRLGIMPRITEGINDRALEHINMTAESLMEINDYMEYQCSRVFDELVRETENCLYIDAEGFSKLHIAMKRQLVKTCIYKVAGRAKDITRDHMESVLALFHMQVGKSVNLPYKMVAVREYGQVSLKVSQERLERLERHQEKATDINNTGTYVARCGGHTVELVVERDVFDPAIFNENQYTKWIDCDIIKSNLQLRTRRQGDYIVVDSKGSRKKLKDYFIDQKIPKEQRDSVPLIADGSEILWIIGHRLSWSYKVDENSKNILRLHIDMKLT